MDRITIDAGGTFTNRLVRNGAGAPRRFRSTTAAAGYGPAGECPAHGHAHDAAAIVAAVRRTLEPRVRATTATV